MSSCVWLICQLGLNHGRILGEFGISEDIKTGRGAVGFSLSAGAPEERLGSLDVDFKIEILPEVITIAQK